MTSTTSDSAANTTLTVAIGSDHRGVSLVEAIVAHLGSNSIDVHPVGCCTVDSCDYPDNAYRVGRAVQSGDATFGILVCGSGIGVSMAANKVDGVRAALVFDAEAAAMTRRHNDANVLCMSAERTDAATAVACVDSFLATEFEGGRHARRVEKMTAIERGDDPQAI